MTKGTLACPLASPGHGPAPGILWPAVGEKGHAKSGWDGQQMVPGTSGFPGMAHRLTQGSCSKCVGRLSAVPSGSSPLLHAGGKWVSQRQTAKRVEVL